MHVPVPVSHKNDVTPERVVVLRLHDTVVRFHIGMKFSFWYNNRGEFVSV